MIETKAAFETICKQFQAQMADLDFAEAALRTGAGTSQDSLIVPFFDMPYRASARGTFDPSGIKATPAVGVALYTYIFRCPKQLPPEGEWFTFREFKDSGPLAGHFTANTNRLIASRFSGKRNELEKACRALGAECEAGASGYDLTMTFKAFPRVPLSLRFNDQDENLPAQSVMLFKKSVEACLDLQAMIILGTFLAGNLVRFEN
jgi:hypothetical protein